MRLVLDTSVLVSGLRSNKGASYRLLQLAQMGRFVMLTTPALFLEYEDVLSRPEQQAVHGLNMLEIGQFMGTLARVMSAVEVHFRWRPQLMDPNDEMVLETALNGRAKAIVTHNVRDFAGIDQSFGLHIWSPAQALEELKR
jgi:putative PIN family toxin of toxin-antitoxin system